MTFYAKDPATDKAVRKLAKLKGKTLTETIREAVEYALAEQTREKRSHFLNASSLYRTGLPLVVKPDWKQIRRFMMN